ncbi:peroxisome biogenesis factor 10-like isoform X2 [Selaginella moellendorffii]|uniref:peroxisome biogenesis factor 10-like isoform X2 n=1 Tax=Selaginella moellendorffii TaxID=88036 RepID=UPI000D1C46C3|nr:peroxisome biogenesis factor 10-like isoform X2 [Selaginella moellendorffii]|eukprot:XP_024545002.1 peroxisome biogenesis factor 10-like isoform X2 [Selaginella moellendorffii]
MREGMFPPAAAPEVMRAAEKDEQYASFVCESCYDAFRHAFGTRLAVAYQNETKLAGRALYYLLTTGAGLQTLGEEYCDILQVAGASGLPPSPARRVLLIFYQAILPYLGERLSSRAAARGILLANEEGRRARSSLSGGENTRATATSSLSYTGLLQKSDQVLKWLQCLWSAALQGWAVILPSLREALLLLSRANLMLFYFDGIYYHLAKRAARIRYIHMGKAAQQRPRYHMLGMFLLLQLSILSGHWLRRSILPAVALSMQSPSVNSASPPGATHQRITILDEDGNMPQRSSLELEKEASSTKCPLCLSPRQNPTATPCGHVFCWTCVAEWCNEKPECPLCRAPVLHSSLVCVYHADF